MARKRSPDQPPQCADRNCQSESKLRKWARLLWCPEHLGPVVEGQARMAKARLEAGIPLSPDDRTSLDHFPNPAPSTTRSEVPA